MNVTVEVKGNSLEKEIHSQPELTFSALNILHAGYFRSRTTLGKSPLKPG